MKTYIATVKILLAAPNLEDACDVVVATLNDPINTAIVDWSYLPTADGKTFTYPEPGPEIDPATYVEGSFLLHHQTEATVDYPAEILKLLERNTAAGAYLSQVFADWLDITHATLAALPAHAASAASKRSDAGTLAEDTPETQALFARCRSRYPRPEYWQRFQQAFHLLLDSAEGFWDKDTPTACDTIGAVYMLTAYKKHSGQYFTPWEDRATHGANDHPGWRGRDHRPAAPGPTHRHRPRRRQLTPTRRNDPHRPMRSTGGKQRPTS